MLTHKVADIMTTEVMSVGPDTTLRDVASLLGEHHLSGVPVVEGRRVVGVVSASDVLRYAVAEATVGAVADESEWEDEEVEEWREGGAPPADYYTRLEIDGEVEIEELPVQREVLQRATAADVMTRVLCALPPDATIVEAANYMLWAEVHRILVVERNELVGIVTTMDIVRAVAQGGIVR